MADENKDVEVIDAQSHADTVGYPIPRGFGARRDIGAAGLQGTVTEQQKVADGAKADLDGAVVNVEAGKVAGQDEDGKDGEKTEAPAPAARTATKK